MTHKGIEPASTIADLQAERRVLAEMISSRDATADVIEVIKARDFVQPEHRAIFEAISALHTQGQPATPETLTRELAEPGNWLDILGGERFLEELATSAQDSRSAEHFAEVVLERALIRRLIDAGHQIVELGYAAAVAGTVNVDELIDAAEEEVYSITKEHVYEDTRMEQLDRLEGALESIEFSAPNFGIPRVVSTGFSELDDLIRGFRAGQVVVISSVAGIGKSTLALNFARANAIENGLPCVLFSLELESAEVTMRMLSAEARVPIDDLRAGAMTDEEWRRLAEAMPKVSGAPLFIRDPARPTVQEIRHRCRRLQRRHDLRLVIIDTVGWVQLAESTNSGDRAQELVEVSHQLSVMAKELGLSLILFSNLGRLPESRMDQCPQLRDLESCLEENADTVIFLHRDDAYDKLSPRAGEADLFVAKHRYGPTAMVSVAFQPHYSRFVSMRSW